MTDKLFIFEMANNHQGSMDHAKNIIDEMAAVKDKYSISAAVKFQYRDLDTFIHPDYQTDYEGVKHIPRFMSTRLSYEQFKELNDYVKSKGMLTCVTPFDENSVDKIVEQDLDIIKVASCSANDWPLLEKISNTDKQVVISTGGLKVNDVDNLVSFFNHKKSNFFLLHCVAIYPAPFESLDLDFIQKYTKRYPGISIGYSGHEDPTSNIVQQIAAAKGASIFERHVGLETDKISLNKYSLNPKQVDSWVKSVLEAITICGQSKEKNVSEVEEQSLLSLRRGVFANHEISPASEIKDRDVFFAMPCSEGQLSSADFGKMRTKVISSKAYKENEMIQDSIVELDSTSKIRRIINYTKGVLNEANIYCDDDMEYEISHHYGLENFHKTGVVLVNLINRNYTKKLLIQQPGQKNPYHMHKKKEETFIVLEGSGYIDVEGKVMQMKKGDKILIEPDKMHSFGTDTGVVFEEISTTHYRSDSYYEDQSIAAMDPLERKTIVSDIR